MANPTLLTSPIAENGDKNVIPASTGATTGLLDQEHGFQQINELPLQAGGLPPQRKDFNGAFNLLSKILFYVQKGWTFEFDESQSYFAGCIVRDTLDGNMYECLNDVSASSTHPSVDSTNWRIMGKNGYRQNSTAYAYGDIAYSEQLPAGWFLMCSTAGITDSTEPTIIPAWIGTVVDGSVIWTMQNPFYFALHQMPDATNHNMLMGGTSEFDGGWIDLRGSGIAGYGGSAILTSTDGIDKHYLSLLKNGKLYLGSNTNFTQNPCINDSLIVNASFGVNGYIKFGNGFLIQWGQKDIPTQVSQSITLPLSYADTNYVMLASPLYNGEGSTWAGATVGVEPYTTTQAYVHSPVGRIKWLTMGYGS